MTAGNSYLFKATVDRPSGRAVREGILVASYPGVALDMLVTMAIEEWKRPLLKIELFQTDHDGVMTSAINVGDRINGVLRTYQALEPGKFKHLSHRRQIVAGAKDNAEDKDPSSSLLPGPTAKKETKTTTTTKRIDVKVTADNWPWILGDYYQVTTSYRSGVPLC